MIQSFERLNFFSRIVTRKFHQRFRAALTNADLMSAKHTDDLNVFLRFWDLHAQKLDVKCW